MRKLLKERLNIDCLRMLGEESSIEEDLTGRNKKNLSTNDAATRQANESYRILMKEIGVDMITHDGLSAAFV